MTSTESAWVNDGNGPGHLEPSYTPDMADEIDTLEDTMLQITRGMDRIQAVRTIVAQFEEKLAEEIERRESVLLSKIAGGLILRDNTTLHVYGLAFAAGLEPLNGITMTEAAVKLDFTRAAVSQSTKWWKNFLELKPSRYMKSEKACESYSIAQKAKHWRNNHKTSVGSIEKVVNPLHT